MRTQELEREKRIEKEKAEGGPDPRIVEMEALGAQVAPRGIFHVLVGVSILMVFVRSARWFVEDDASTQEWLPSCAVLRSFAVTVELCCASVGLLPNEAALELEMLIVTFAH